MQTRLLGGDLRVCERRRPWPAVRVVDCGQPLHSAAALHDEPVQVNERAALCS